MGLLLILMTISHSALAFHSVTSSWTAQSQPLLGRAVDNSSLLRCLQVTPPVLRPDNLCQQTLMVHTFAFSYGQPFVGNYYPPPCDFNRVALEFTVTSAGRQFDRLAVMYLDDIEIFRTSTAEPTANGIIWTYTKDVSAYSTLFNARHKIVFDLGNLIDDIYTGTWNTTLVATFFKADNTLDPADVIIPISAHKSAANKASAFIVPESKAIDSLQLPKNTKKAVFSISACGQSAEEFWWSNVLSSDTRVFGNDTTLYGHSPFRELQLLIDGNLAGVAWPFPVIFTGGIVPGFWRPLVGIDTFDLKEDEIDISPFIPLVNDGYAHTFEIRVVGIDDDDNGIGHLTENIESNWVVTGKVFIWIESGTNLTTGTLPVISSPPPVLRLQSTTKKHVNGTIDSLKYAIHVSRQISVESTIMFPTGLKTLSWKQNLEFSNSGTLSNQGNDQIMRQITSGTSTSSSGYTRSFEYPLWVVSSYNAPSGGNITIDGRLGRGKNVKQLGELAFLNEWRTFDLNRLPSAPQNLSFIGSSTKNWQNGTASYLSVPALKKSYGSGNTEQLFALSGINERAESVVQGPADETRVSDEISEELYQRCIIAGNDTIVHDKERFGGQHNQRGLLNLLSHNSPVVSVPEYANSWVKAVLGRGPN
ncbi:peptide N-acetyl-beta-D-glucosaminyl asparaginase amidase A-domain-containing protein [Ampelomyces quisqualis]|uniref:Peptide N-acetyl-beta-D-glucosaminyl asparaginase amidase A-domain-containing protein n=1 Tax=Ampelomyces quisqualis TaxID=50730 RepID=A0A6A5R863_AMPQU|nr:peptide N-acetyl-beta-D-glucosaminyl asparaginase amidase A-domain-containing protein [Ampelomyces quisqualis]